MNRDTQIVFVHYGDSWYLPYVLNQAKCASKGAGVVLIGDANVRAEIPVIPFARLENKYAAAFRKRYCHMSTNDADYELFCWLRWFYLLEYVRCEDVSSIVYLDSDVLLFSGVNDIGRAYGTEMVEGALMLPEQDDNSFFWAASGHISYWTKDFLEEYCDFCVESFGRGKYLEEYQKKWDWHLRNKRPGGICDMTTLYFFWKERQERIFNLAKEFNGNVCDLAMCTGNNYHVGEYSTRSGIKEVVFVNRHPYFRSSIEPKNLVRVHALHFQGIEKQGIRRAYSGAHFKGKRRQEAGVAVRSIRRRLQSIRRRIVAS